MRWRLNLHSIIIVLLSLYFVLFLISPILLTNFSTPPNHVNWFVGLHYPDYFEYLSFIKQGQQGKFLLDNLFTNDDFGKFTATWWIYPLIGNFSRVFLPFLSLPTIYWLSSAFLGLIYLLLIYKTISIILVKEKFLYKLTSFFLVLTATGFYKITQDNGLKFQPFDFWYSIGSPFSRFSLGAPHHQLAHILFLLALIVLTKSFIDNSLLKKTVLFFLFSLILLFSSPPQLFLFFTIWFSTIFFSSINRLIENKENLIDKLKDYLPMFFTVLLMLPIAYIINQNAQAPTLISGRLWDLQNFFYPPLTLFMLTSGPLFVLAILGIKQYFLKINLLKTCLFFVAFFSFFFCLVPFKNVLSFFGFHNLRLMSPVSYIFLSTSSVLFIKNLFKKQKLFILVSFVIIFFFILPIYTLWQQSLKTPYNAAYLQFMPNELYQGLKFLEKKETQSIILTSPASSLGAALPAITGKRVYLGREIFTLNYPEKTQKANSFYQMKIELNEGKKFLKQEKINYIVFYLTDGDKNQFESYYNFLKLVFKNSQVVIYSL